MSKNTAPYEKSRATPASAFVVACLLSACTSLPDDIVGSERLGGAYDAVAACVYSRLTDGGEIGISFADLKAENRVIIRQVNQNTPIWQIDLTRLSATETRVDIKAMSTIWSREFYAKKLLPWVRACAH